MDLATAPVRPGFVLFWIAAVTGSAFLFVTLVCPQLPDTAAHADPATQPATHQQTVPSADGSPAPAGPGTPLDNAPVFLSDPYQGQTQAAPEDETDGKDGEIASPTVPTDETSASTAVGALSEEQRSPALHTVFHGTGTQFLPYGQVLPPLSLGWSLTADPEEDEDVRLEVRPVGRGLYLLRLLLARYHALGLEDLPQELLAALPPRVVERLAAGGDGGSSPPNTGDSIGGDSGFWNGARNSVLRLRKTNPDHLDEAKEQILTLVTREEAQRMRLRLAAIRSHRRAAD